jgi:hypothetical protein
MQFAAFSPVETRRRPSHTAPILLIAGLLASLSAVGCGVDDSGLNSSSPKLQHDGSVGGTIGKSDGAAQDAASGGGGAGQAVSGAGGGGGPSTGGGGTGGGPPGGTDGSAAGAIGSGAAGATGAAGTVGVAGANGAAGIKGTAGVGGAAGLGGVAGVSGTGGTVGAAGRGGAGGIGQAGAGGGVGGIGGIGGMGGIGLTGGRGGLGGAAGRGGGTCTPSNCADGCCANNQCVHNTTAQQCGSMGVACMACAPCDLCSMKGQCSLDPSSQWTITADSAQLAKSPSGGGTWDPPIGDEGGSAPDPFCEFENPSGTVNAQNAGVTSTVTDEYSVTWDQVITPAGGTVSASVLMANNPVWRIWVGDEDCGMAGNQSTCGSIGQTACSYQQPITAAALQSGTLAITNFQSCVSLTLSFTCQPSAAAGAP